MVPASLRRFLRNAFDLQAIMVWGVTFLALQGCTVQIPSGGTTTPSEPSSTATVVPTATPAVGATTTPTPVPTATQTPSSSTTVPPECKLLNVSTTEASGYALDTKNVSETQKVTLYRVAAQTTSTSQKACNTAGCHSSVPSGSAPSNHNDGRLTVTTTVNPTPVAVASTDANLVGSDISGYPPGSPNHGFRFSFQSLDSTKKPVSGDRVYVTGQGSGGQASSESKQVP